jgi:hypothetical protein
MVNQFLKVLGLGVGNIDKLVIGKAAVRLIGNADFEDDV